MNRIDVFPYDRWKPIYTYLFNIHLTYIEYLQYLTIFIQRLILTVIN